MANTSTIEWTNATWNPVSGCERVSPGCDRCYALRFAERFRGVPGHYYGSGFDVELRPGMLERPGTWRDPKLVFVNSMGDLFHRDVPDGYIDRVFEQMERHGRHTYQLLTKRPERMRRYLKSRYGSSLLPEQIWPGVSVESNAYAWRADMLREVNAQTRFLSVEPMLGPIDEVDLRDVGWVIVGGESGWGYRSMEGDWARDVRDRCSALGIPFFFKQWHKRGTGRSLDGRTWDEMPPVGATVSS